MPKRQVESQKRKRLMKKRELKEAKEASDTSKRKSMFPAAKDVPPRPKYSTALQTATHCSRATQYTEMGL